MSHGTSRAVEQTCDVCNRPESAIAAPTHYNHDLPPPSKLSGAPRIMGDAVAGLMICRDCFYEWYDGGLVDPAEIKAAVLAEAEVTALREALERARSQ